jgi:hypothetical protein
MSRQLAECPYCGSCEITLNDSLDVTFHSAGGSSEPCPHLVWVEGRYSQWGLNALPGRKTKIARMVGSNEFEWQHPGLTAAEDPEQQRAYLKELARAGSNWEYAPLVKHTVRLISAEETVTEPDGRTYPSCEVEGVAIFTADAQEFLAGLPEGLARWTASFTDLPGSSLTSE